MESENIKCSFCGNEEFKVLTTFKKIEIFFNVWIIFKSGKMPGLKTKSNYVCNKCNQPLNTNLRIFNNQSDNIRLKFED